MIQLAGVPFQQSSMWPIGGVEDIIVQRMNETPVVYSYDSIEELIFEVTLRKNIIASARMMNEGNARFETFEKSRCNPQYWQLTRIGGFRLKPNVPPSEAIEDIFENSSMYAFECATAKIIIYYHAVLNSLGKYVFNRLFQNLYLYSWHFDPDLGIHTVETNYFLPGDVVYFDNPDFNPDTSWWRGENAVVLEDGTYFGHGIGIETAQQIIVHLNRRRKPGGYRSAYLKNSAARLDFKHLAKLSVLTRSYPTYKPRHFVIRHNKSSISFKQYVFYLYKVYTQMHS
ncbi:protein-glutamine gamma-glutamyltransferase [Pseudobacillus wudalianchiensis]|uniref:Protein-glutamine gamma-glutamyltransferase n=1 Tax=Pseudobacillus wudalianchiensis TaxID=1743143 RepID=A0A1B9AT18_9BACI|nr:protein-glutamine gamma-glutamyltransferase [Bacillus wudalianchiensis]OCA87032.1 protein-glutamine gamma-glutamyltransferase [Bacillus wudalianchiensis]